VKRKAASTLIEAVELASHGRWSGAANRTYYALYQALVGELESRGRRPEEFAAIDPSRPGWRHATLMNNALVAGLTGPEVTTLRDAWSLRVRADYESEPVRSEELEPVLTKARGILRALGVGL
jgi:hypothetical protein